MTLEHFRAIKEEGGWGAYAAFLLSEPQLPPAVIAQFGTYWIEAGHHLREQIADDHLLVLLLRRLLPPYEGGSIELFRGENRNRWEKQIIGLAWTENIDTARMFGRGLNAVDAGGVLLRARFEPEVIISGPNSHSNYLGEKQFTVDPFIQPGISVVEFYPAIT